MNETIWTPELSPDDAGQLRQWLFGEDAEKDCPYFPKIHADTEPPPHRVFPELDGTFIPGYAHDRDGGLVLGFTLEEVEQLAREGNNILFSTPILKESESFSTKSGLDSLNQYVTVSILGDPNMPHDNNRHPLKVGDRVSIPGTIVSICPGEYCTTTVETDFVMPGNGTKTQISAINAAQLLYVGPGVDPDVKAKCDKAAEETPQTALDNTHL